MLEGALARLRASYAARAQESRFTSLKGFLTGAPPAGSRAEIAAELGLTEGALGVAVHRLRERYRAALLGAVRDTVDSDEAVAAELEALFAALGG